MNFWEIEAFLAIVETRSLSKAAQSLFLAQCTVTHRLQSLEKKLNNTLVVRQKGRRSIELTQKGQEFIPIAERWMSLWKDTQAYQKSDLRLTLSVACIESLNIFMFPPLYHEITSQDTTFTLRVFSRDSSVIYDLLQNYEVDIGFGILPTKNPNIITEPLFGEEIFLVNAIEHAWAADVVHPSELDPSEEIYMFWGHNTERWHDLWWGPASTPFFYTNTSALLFDYLKGSSHWALVPASVARAFEKTGAVKSYRLMATPKAHLLQADAPVPEIKQRAGPQAL
jgi:DNA-binding transcriptional LysR family regulator